MDSVHEQQYNAIPVWMLVAVLCLAQVRSGNAVQSLGAKYHCNREMIWII